MNSVKRNGTHIALGNKFVEALAARDFDQLQTLFANPLRFRAMVPNGIREAKQPLEALGWFRRWFGGADHFELQTSSVDEVVDRLSVNYRIRLHDEDGWQVIEQKAYCKVQTGSIRDMALVCSGFCVEEDTVLTQQSADAYYDAGTKGCAEGPLDEISGLILGLQPGQSLQVHATDPSVAADLPAWCRLAGYDFEKQAQDHYLIRKKE
jgi:TusA-related sulfurtransferase